MSRLRGLWFESRHLVADAPGVHEELRALDEPSRERLLAAGDRLAEVSLTLAQQYCRAAPRVWALGADAWARWLGRGERLAGGSAGSREVASAYFSLDPLALARVPEADLDLWLGLTERLLAVSRRLGETFVAASGPVLADLAERPARLTAWVEQALALAGGGGWEDELAALHFLESTRQVLPLCAPAEYRAWAAVHRAAERIGTARGEVASGPPPALAALGPDARRALLELAAGTAATAPVIAVELFLTLPATLAAAGDDAPALLASLAPVAETAPAALTDLLPVLGAILATTAADSRPGVIALAAALARDFPPGVVPFYRVLPRLLERTGLDGIARWVDAGLGLVREERQSGLAYFGLESRTSRAVLSAESTAVEFAEVQGLLKRYLHMLTGHVWRVASDAQVTYRPPFATPVSGEGDGAVAEALFPVRIDVFTTAEANLRLYRLIAAQHAGRVEFGSGMLRPSVDEFLAEFERPDVAGELFTIFEGVRVDAALARAYRGLAADLDGVERDLRRGGLRLPGTTAQLADALGAARRPDVAARLPPIAARLAEPDATVVDTADATRAIYALLDRAAGMLALGGDPPGFADLLADTEVLDARLDLDAGDDDLAAGGAAAPDAGSEAQPTDEDPGEVALGADEVDGPPGAPMDPAELLRLLKEGADLTIKQGRAEEVEALGLYVSSLAGKLPRERLQELQARLREAQSGRAGAGLPTEGEGDVVYDEWDHRIADYRSAWCRLAEVPLESDTGDFFQRTLATHAALLPEIRRQFQRIRPEAYRIVHGLEDGEDFDLNAVVTARTDRRAGRPPSSKVYQARQREERDVATLFLIDMSASTDEPVPGELGRRVIDVTKEALVVMTEALEEIGDAYGIYGFSGHGRHQVEFYQVKHFHERLTPAVRGRVGAIEPKRSTRMGTALRHAVTKLRAVGARSKHVILLSDGFPQDLDYGDDRRSNVYGIQDTMVAFQEATRAGVMPFCITVDKAGHDYLKDICEASRYMVIEDITALPHELPKIYQRFVRP